MGSNQTDVMQLFVVMAAAIFGQPIADVVGPYLLIIFAAATGAGWSLGRREAKGKWSAFFYFVRVVFTAILLTVVIAKVVVMYMPKVEGELLIAPVALIIGLIGDDWLKVFDWLVEVGKKFANRFVNKKLGDE